MFKWLEKFKSQPPVAIPVDEEELDEVVQEVKSSKNVHAPAIASYPKEDFFAYWEVQVTPNNGSYKGVVRYYAYDTPQKNKSSLLDESSFVGKSEAEVLRQAWRNIPVKMEKYRG